jgi:hypothetical protein
MTKTFFEELGIPFGHLVKNHSKTQIKSRQLTNQAYLGCVLKLRLKLRPKRCLQQVTAGENSIQFSQRKYQCFAFFGPAGAGGDVCFSSAGTAPVSIFVTRLFGIAHSSPSWSRKW